MFMWHVMASYSNDELRKSPHLKEYNPIMGSDCHMMPHCKVSGVEILRVNFVPVVSKVKFTYFSISW